MTLERHLKDLRHRLEACGEGLDQVSAAHVGLRALCVMVENPAIARAIELHRALIETLQELEHRLPRARPATAVLIEMVTAKGVRGAARALNLPRSTISRWFAEVSHGTAMPLPMLDQSGTVTALVHGEKTEPKRTTQRGGSVNSRKRAR